MGKSHNIRRLKVKVKYPQVKVQLTGEDGNAFSIMGKVQNALRRAGVSKDEIDLYIQESTSGDYDHLLATAHQWVDVN
jgi:3-oxoacyl-[acyl-carrier-protein] synthase III